MRLLPVLLAPGIFGAEMEDVGQPIALHPQEEIFVARAGEKRRRDFALGRTCAHAALAQLGLEQAMIAKAEGGAPLWPAGILGSITHTKGYAAALVAEAGRFRGLGLDAERVGGVTQDLWPRLFTPEECDHLMTLDHESRRFIATMAFSAKEAAYKAWQMTGGLKFRDIHIAPRDGGFVASRSGESLQGRFTIKGDLVLTAAWF